MPWCTIAATCRYQHGVAKSDSLYDPAERLEARANLDLGECGQQEVGFYHLHQHGVDFVFVDHPCYQRAGGAVSLPLILRKQKFKADSRLR